MVDVREDVFQNIVGLGFDRLLLGDLQQGERVQQNAFGENVGVFGMDALDRRFPEGDLLSGRKGRGLWRFE